MATQTLSPKRAPERLQQHRHYVIVLAHQSALKTIKAKLRAQGIKLHDFSARDLRIQPEAYFDANRQQLIDEAKGVIATSPYFAQWRLPSCGQVAQKRALKRLSFFVQPEVISGARAY
jgi:hypothetical protein